MSTNSYIMRYRKSGWVLYTVCALLIAIFFLIIGVDRYRSGSTRLLAINIEQETMVLLAQAGVDEILADIKNKINSKDNEVGIYFYDCYKNGGQSFSKDINYNASSLNISNDIAKKQFGNSATITGKAVLTIDEMVGDPVPSYIGHVDITSTLKTTAIKNSVEITERREIKVSNLSDPFLDSYALFVKDYNISYNLAKNFVVNGIKNGDQSKSYIYLGNRYAPSCSDCKNILLDINFEKDRNLPFFKNNYKDTGFNSIIGKADSVNNFFWTVKLSLNRFFPEKFTTEHLALFQQIENIKAQLDEYWKIVVEAHNKMVTGQYGSEGLTYADVGAMSIYEDAFRSGEEEFKRSFLETFRNVWKYYFGYTDYSHLLKIMDKKPFYGLNTYFSKLPNDCVRKIGGSMPAFFGEDRQTPVFIEGPVYLRFFKLAFVDWAEGEAIMGMNPKCDYYQLEYSKDANSLSNKSVTLDSFTNILGSHPIDDQSDKKIPINALFFGDDEVTLNPQQGIDAKDIFPRMNDSKLVTHYYVGPGDFLFDRIKEADNKKILDLDGICVITGNLDLSNVELYKGKGTLLVIGNCLLSNLKPINNDLDNNYLKIYCTNGSFAISGESAEITGILAAMYQSDNYSSNQTSLGIDLNNKKLVLNGSLLVDSLPYNLSNSDLTINHNDNILSNDYPVRVSVGSTKCYYNINYAGKD